MNTEQKNKAIGEKLTALIAGGMELREAWNTVFPKMPYDQFVGEIYDALKS